MLVHKTSHVTAPTAPGTLQTLRAIATHSPGVGMGKTLRGPLLGPGISLKEAQIRLPSTVFPMDSMYTASA